MCPLFTSLINYLHHSLFKCGHPYCHKRLELQIEVVSQSKLFPLVCAAEKCNSHLSWLDVEDAYCGDQRGQNQLINSAIIHFVATTQ